MPAFHPTRGPLAASAILVGMLLAACGGDDPAAEFVGDAPDAEPVRAVVRTAVPLAYAASVAMAAFDGDIADNAEIIANTCPGVSCLTLVIHLDPLTLPVAFADYGDIVVFGLWASPTEAVLTVGFVGMNAGSGHYGVHSVSTFPARRTLNGVSIVYASLDINLEPAVDPVDGELQAELDRLGILTPGSPGIGLGMDAWVVDANHAGTPTDFSDDRYTVSGGGQYIATSANSASVLQLGMAGVEVGPSCALNPVDGLAVVQKVAAGPQSAFLGSATLRFDTVCDGTADVLVALGVYAGSNGASIALGL